MMIEILLSLLLIFNPILLNNDFDIVNNYNIELENVVIGSDIINNSTIELEYVKPLSDRELYLNHLNDSINRSKYVDRWTCFDYSIDFAENNRDWGVVTISKSFNFCPKSHMINYKFYDNNTMIVYDGLLDNLYYIINWQWDMDYYHFWIDGSQPVRNYKYLVDNRDVIL